MGNITPNDDTHGNSGTPGMPGSTPNNNESTGPKKPIEMDPNVLAALNEHAAALRSEFELTNKELSSNSEQEDLKAFWRNKVPNAAAQIAWLAMHAQSESVRANLNKYIIAEAYAETGSDELSEILKNLTDSVNT